MFWVILCVIIGSDKAPEDRIFTVVAAENGLKIYVTMPIAIATDQWPLSYSPIIGQFWCGINWTVTHIWYVYGKSLGYIIITVPGINTYYISN